MKEIKAIIQPFMLEQVLEALSNIALPGLTISQVQGWGKSRAASAAKSVSLGGHKFADRVKIEIVVGDELAPSIADIIAKAARTGNLGDGKIFISDITDAVKIRTDERGEQAL